MTKPKYVPLSSVGVISENELEARNEELRASLVREMEDETNPGDWRGFAAWMDKPVTFGLVRKGAMMREPTTEECNARARVEMDGRVFYAGYYPQMGGYVGICWVEPMGHCFDVYVWHDGEFPFGEGSVSGERKPRHLHHCDPAQFVDFGEWIMSLPD